MKKINESFVCAECGELVQPASKTCRNHCPKCFTALHVDDAVPWDRASFCWAKMYPIEYIIANWETKILFQCIECGKKHHNKAAEDDEIISLNELIYKYKKFF